MKNKISLLIAGLCLQFLSNAYAQEGWQTSSEVAEIPKSRTMKEQVWGLTPQLGLMSYYEKDGTYSSRATAGIGFDLNALSLMGEPSNIFYLGFNTGFIYSHLGSDGSDIFGTGGRSANDDSSNYLAIPVNLKFGYNLSSDFRLSARGGGNWIYRSVANSIDLGEGSNSGSDLWKIYPNAGIDAEYQVSKNLSLMLHPDVTFTEGKDIFVATLGATIMGY